MVLQPGCTWELDGGEGSHRLASPSDTPAVSDGLKLTAVYSASTAPRETHLYPPWPLGALHLDLSRFLGPAVGVLAMPSLSIKGL